MKITFIDHIVIIVTNIPNTEKFYSTFLGTPGYTSDSSLIYNIGSTRLFFVLPKAEFVPSDKDQSGLNHIAYGVRSLEELQEFETMLNDATIKHSGIKKDVHGNKDYIWFDD